jgi:two-component system response regulator YesN
MERVRMIRKIDFWPQSLRVYKQNSLFLKLLFFFTLLAVTCTLIVGYATYTCSARVLLEEVGNANFYLLKQAQEAIDKEIVGLKKVALQAATDRRIIKALYNGLSTSTEDIQLSQEIITYLNVTKTTFIDSAEVWLYFAKTRTVLSHEGRFSEGFFFREICGYPPGTQWPKLFKSYSAFHSIGHQLIAKGENRGPVITFMASLPVFEYSPLGVIVFNVEESLLEQAINNVSGKTPALTLVLDAGGEMICGSGGMEFPQETFSPPVLRKILKKHRKQLEKTGTIKQRIKGREYTISYIASTVNDWRYISLIPSRFVTRKIRYIGYVTLVVVGACLMLSMVLSYFLSRKLYHPIDDILNSIDDISGKNLRDEPGPPTDELQFIDKMIRYLYSEKENLQNVFEKSLPMLKEKFLADIVEGKVNRAELTEIGKRLDFNFDKELFQTVVGEIDEYQERKEILTDSVQLKLIQMVNRMAAEILAGEALGYAFRRGNSQFCLIINLKYPAHEAGRIYDLLTRIAGACYRNYGLTLTLAVGNVYQNVDGCATSYQEALAALKHKLGKGPNSIIHYDEIRNTPGRSFDYPIEMEKRISNMLKAGELDSVLGIFEELTTRNLSGKKNSPEMIENLFNALAGTIVRTVYDLHFTMEEVFGEAFNVYVDLGGRRTVAEKQQYLTELFTKLVTCIKEKRLAHNQKIYERILEYITRNYASDLCLDRVAEAVGLSSSYLSWIFKEISGANFVDFINKFRIEKAKELLTESGMNISDVAIRVGYSNSNTFIKVFKKYEGITPGQFREAD